MPNQPSAAQPSPPLTGPGGEAADAPSSEAATDRLAVLSTLDDRPLHEHPEVYQGLHEALQASLAEIDSA